MIPLHNPIPKLQVKTTDIVYAVKQWMGLAFVRRVGQPVSACIVTGEEVGQGTMDIGAQFNLIEGHKLSDGKMDKFTEVKVTQEQPLYPNVTQGNVDYLAQLLRGIVNAGETVDSYTEYRRWNPEEFFRAIEEVDGTVYHTNDFDDVNNEEYDGDALRRLKADGKMEIWTVRSGVHGYAFILTDPDDPHEYPDSRWHWRAFSYLCSDKGLPDTISYMGEGIWGTMRTLMINFLEVYEHEDFNVDVSDLMGALKSIVVLRGNIYHLDDVRPDEA